MDRVTPADLPAVRSYLAARADCALFPLSNLDRFGLDGPAPYAPRMWAATRGGQVDGVLTMTPNGMVLPVLNAGHAPAAADVMGGRAISGLVGARDMVRPLLAAARLEGRPMTLDRDEEHHALDLADLAVPEGPGSLVPLSAAEPETLIAWRRDYDIEALGHPPDTAARQAREEHARAIEAGQHRVLMVDDTPCAMTGFNAGWSDLVQVGGVYVPPNLRGRGHARRAVALHLAEARDAGARRGILFTSSVPAIRAYLAIGFRRIGDWTLCLFPAPVTSADG